MHPRTAVKYKAAFAAIQQQELSKTSGRPLKKSALKKLAHKQAHEEIDREYAIRKAAAKRARSMKNSKIFTAEERAAFLANREDLN